MKREKAEKLFNLLGNIDDKLIAEADEVPTKPTKIIQLDQKKNIMRLTTLAASVIFLAVGAWGLSQLGMQMNETDMAHDQAEDLVMEEAEVEADWNGEIAEDVQWLDVALEVEILEDSRLSVVVINNADRFINTSYPFLEYFHDEEWHEIPIIDADIDGNIEPGGADRFNLDLSAYDMPEGHLLRVRTIIFWEGLNQQDLIYEFELED